MNRIFIAFTGLLLMVCACNQDDDAVQLNVCNTTDPLEELDWLKTIKDNLEISASAAGYEIIQYSYQGSDVFWVDDCYQCPDGLIQVYDCEGTVICAFMGIDGRNTCTNFDADATDRIVLLDGINRSVLKGVLSYTGSVAADGCEWLLETDTDTYSLQDYDAPTTADARTVLVAYEETNDTFSCGLMPAVFEQVIALRICELGALTIDSDAYDNAPDDFLAINSVSIEDHFLKINYGASGCSGDSWDLKLISAEGVMESYPPQRNIRLSLKNDENCLAYFVKDIAFDIRELQTDGNQVILNIGNSGEQIVYAY
jgi:hypothetical protein